MSRLARLLRSLGHRRWFAAIGRRGARFDMLLYRLTGGRVSSVGAAVPVLLLTTTGRRTGKPRTTPVMYVPDGDDFVVTCENFGQQRAAAWPLNLKARPECRVQVGSRTLDCVAEPLTGEELESVWARFVEIWPAHETYLRRSGRRHTFRLSCG